MKGDDFRTVCEAIDVALKHRETELFAVIDRKIESYRRAVWVRDEWCCSPMATFALHFWNAPRPKRDYEFGTTLAVRGQVVNYCPFCGAYVGRETAKGGTE